MDTRQKIFLITAFVALVFGLALVWHTITLGRARLIFCDVGQGDGMLLITPSGKKIVVDGGPGNKIMDCLSSKIPFWDKQIDMILSTHPQQDHMEGLVSVLAKYDVKNIVATGFTNNTNVFRAWKGAVDTEGAKVIKPVWGQKYVYDSASMTILWPTNDAYLGWVSKPPADLNDTSIVSRFDDGNFCAYLTGDTPKEIIDKVVDKKCAVLKVAHHGSLTGTDEKELEEIDPKIAVIQVGKNNRFGHPKQQTLDLLAARKIKVLRNDQLGTIEIDTDGKNIWIK